MLMSSIEPHTRFGDRTEEKDRFRPGAGDSRAFRYFAFTKGAITGKIGNQIRKMRTLP